MRNFFLKYCEKRTFFKFTVIILQKQVRFLKIQLSEKRTLSLKKILIYEKISFIFEKQPPRCWFFHESMKHTHVHTHTHSLTHTHTHKKEQYSIFCESSQTVFYFLRQLLRNACKKTKAHILSPGDNYNIAAPPHPMSPKPRI